VKVDLYEKIWIGLAALMIGGFLAAIVYGAAAHAVHPPSHIETIDPLRVRTDSEFAAPGVRVDGDGVTVVMVAELYRFIPGVVRVPAGRPVRFRLTSPDVMHGFQIVGTNANTMAIPGYVSELTITFPEPGEHLIVCNEYCGLAHHQMQGRLIVEPRQ
jgi:cytochrome c oxidase subunit II